MKELKSTPWALWGLIQRFLKFGTIGASGLLVNLSVLHFSQAYLFQTVPSPEIRLNLSLAAAILFATLNNFLWNRHWTWRDRDHPSLLIQFCQYAMACWLAIVLQIVFTNLLVIRFHYLVANTLAIILCGFVNFTVNNMLVFRHRRNAPASGGNL